MAVVKPDIKERLKAAGLWRDFVKRRGELRDSGSTSAQARDTALSEILPKLESMEFETPSGPELLLTNAPMGEPFDNSVEPPSLPIVGSSLFSGKDDASIVSVIQWVARNLEVFNPSPEDAPSAEAWGMLASYRRSAHRKDEFWDKVYTKLIPSRAQLETHSTVDVDGAAIIEAIGRIEEIRAEVEGEVEGEADG